MLTMKAHGAIVFENGNNLRAQALEAGVKAAFTIDGFAEAPLRDRAILIEGNSIRGLVAADAPAPAGAQVLDLTGKFIIPVQGARPIVVSGFSRLVKTRGAAYAFLPSLPALQFISGLT